MKRSWLRSFKITGNIYLKDEDLLWRKSLRKIRDCGTELLVVFFCWPFRIKIKYYSNHVSSSTCSTQKSRGHRDFKILRYCYIENIVPYSLLIYFGCYIGQLDVYRRTILIWISRTLFPGKTVSRNGIRPLLYRVTVTFLWYSKKNSESCQRKKERFCNN